MLAELHMSRRPYLTGIKKMHARDVYIAMYMFGVTQVKSRITERVQKLRTWEKLTFPI